MCYKFKIFCVLLNITLLSTLVSLAVNKDELHKTKLPPCRACKIFVESFKKGLVSTEKGKFEGGDTAWEEAKLGSYAKSEVRLTEIQENICADVEEGKDQCYFIFEEHDSAIETWWFKKQDEEPDFFKYFCIDTLKKCCPENHYGQNCTPCQGYPDKVCSNNGKCKGAGTRKGSGECSCDPGYAGANCDSCAVNYYQAYKDSNKVLCSKCHPACDGPCTKAGVTGCEKCKAGYLSDKEKGCLDINECAAAKQPCSPLQFCVNTDGSYQCLECDRSCVGCTGDGPDMCIQCAKGYKLIDNVCVDSEMEARKQHVFYTRYLTYLGLCIATCIILNKNTTLAAIVGIAVAVYIAASEYILNTPPTPKADSVAEQIFKNTK